MADNDQFDEVAFHTLWASDDPNFDLITAAAGSVRDPQPDADDVSTTRIRVLGLAGALVVMMILIWWML